MYKEAVADYTTAVALDPGNANAYYNRGSSLDKVGAPDTIAISGCFSSFFLFSARSLSLSSYFVSTALFDFHIHFCTPLGHYVRTLAPSHTFTLVVFMNAPDGSDRGGAAKLHEGFAIRCEKRLFVQFTWAGAG